MKKIVGTGLSAMAVGALLASIGCAVQPAEPGTSESTTAKDDTQMPITGTPSPGAPHFERLQADDPVVNLHQITPEEQKIGVVEDSVCSGDLIECYCNDFAWCTTRNICFHVCYQ